jgi:hypothetical protein
MKFGYKPHSKLITIPDDWTPPEDPDDVMMNWEKILTAKGIATRTLSIFNKYQYNVNYVNDELVMFTRGRWLRGKTAISSIELSISNIVYESLLDDITNDGCITEKDQLRYISQLTRITNNGGSTLKSIMQFICSILSNDDNRPTPKFDDKPTLLPFKNGVVDLFTHQFRPYQYDDYITTDTGYNYVQLDYEDPNVIDMAQQVTDFFEGIMPEEEERTFLLQFLASAIDGNWYRQCLMMNGVGGNGKGVLTNILSNVLGNLFKKAENSVLKDLASSSSTMGENVMDLMGKRMVLFDEPENATLAVLKALTSDTANVTARRLYGSNISFVPQWTIFMSLNSPLEFKDTAETKSVTDRIHELFFSRNFTFDESKIGKEEQKKGYTAKFVKANPLFNRQWCESIRDVVVDMLINVWKQYADSQTGKITFTVPKRVMINSNELAGEMSVFGEINTIIKRIDNPSQSIPLSRIWERLQNTERYIKLSTRQKKKYPKKDCITWLTDQGYTIKTIHHQLWAIGAVFDNDDDAFGVEGGNDDETDEEIDMVDC